jgi:hypothetical protein
LGTVLRDGARDERARAPEPTRTWSPSRHAPVPGAGTVGSKSGETRRAPTDRPPRGVLTSARAATARPAAARGAPGPEFRGARGGAGLGPGAGGFDSGGGFDGGRSAVAATLAPAPVPAAAAAAAEATRPWLEG